MTNNKQLVNNLEMRKLNSWAVADEQSEKDRIEYGFCDSDAWNIDTWFCETMRNILIYYRNHLNGHPAKFESIEAWQKEIDKMVLLLDEMNEAHSSFKNPYEKELMRVIEKYPIKSRRTKEGTQAVFPDNKEYKEATEAYIQFDCKRYAYRDACKRQFFRMFEEYFWDLWD